MRDPRATYERRAARLDGGQLRFGGALWCTELEMATGENDCRTRYVL